MIAGSATIFGARDARQRHGGQRRRRRSRWGRTQRSRSPGRWPSGERKRGGRQRTKDVRGERKSHAGVGNAGDNSATVDAQDSGRPEYSRARDAVVGGIGKGAAAGEAA